MIFFSTILYSFILMNFSGIFSYFSYLMLCFSLWNVILELISHSYIRPGSLRFWKLYFNGSKEHFHIFSRPLADKWYSHSGPIVLRCHRFWTDGNIERYISLWAPLYGFIWCVYTYALFCRFVLFFTVCTLWLAWAELGNTDYIHLSSTGDDLIKVLITHIYDLWETGQ